jgi:hypothetical protein
MAAMPVLSSACPRSSSISYSFIEFEDGSQLKYGSLSWAVSQVSQCERIDVFPANVVLPSLVYGNFLVSDKGIVKRVEIRSILVPEAARDLQRELSMCRFNESSEALTREVPFILAYAGNESRMELDLTGVDAWISQNQRIEVLVAVRGDDKGTWKVSPSTRDVL